MRAIGLTLGLCALILMLFQSIRLFITMEPWDSADFLIVSATMSFMSTAFVAIGRIFSIK
jgi:hypothetical protein